MNAKQRDQLDLLLEEPLESARAYRWHHSRVFKWLPEGVNSLIWAAELNPGPQRT